MTTCLPGLGGRNGWCRDESYRLFGIAHFLGYMVCDHTHEILPETPVKLDEGVCSTDARDLVANQMYFRSWAHLIRSSEPGTLGSPGQNRYLSFRRTTYEMQEGARKLYEGDVC